MKKQTKKYLGRTLAISGLCITLGGCNPEPTLQMQKETQLQNSSKYEVKRVAVFEDEIAYQHIRGVYEIKDKETGKTYIGVSGIGITEKANHQSGKHVAEDER